MAYQYEEEELYGRALFSIQNGEQTVEVAFEPIEGKAYLMIIYSSNGDDIVGYHEEEFWDTLYHVLSDHDAGRALDYEIVAR